MAFDKRQRTIWVSIVVGGTLVSVVAALWFFKPARLNEAPLRAEPLVAQGLEEFFRVYWQRPISPQGIPPRSFTASESSLDPQACGSCHPQQYTDWKESFHAKAMGPGPWGQIIDLEQKTPQDAVLCMTCHAPLSEQIPFTPGDSARRNPNFDQKLQLAGITCAACHVRGHQRFGPPRDEKSAASYPAGTPNHDGVQRTPYFERAEFCKDCHQFDPENTTLVNGKPLQDTYREWQNSLWGQGGAACQECHMPNRRHFWKGIHDPEWVKTGIRFNAALHGATKAPGQPVQLRMEVSNAAVGHKFPSYTTPRIFLRAALLDQAGQTLAGSLQEKIVGWDVRFEGGQWREYFDTRISPGETFHATFQWAASRQAKAVRAWVEVHPDYFYHVHFYPAYLTNQDLSSEGRRLIKKALDESGRTPYTLFEKLMNLN